VAGPSNMPGGRECPISWIDDSGNLWLFGGVGYAASGGYGYLNDLWKFDGTNWTWVNGANSSPQRGVYGTRGVANPNNVPGARMGSISWIDGSGNLWLFGGGGYAASGDNGLLNDLWKFDGTNWTWVSGSSSSKQYGIYGTKGVADPNNVPGARYASVSWIDGGNYWLFGGYGYSAFGEGYLNDLWKFNGTNWTWVSGSSSVDQYALYGTKGVAAALNVPGSRYQSISWIDASGNFWLFGGYGCAASGYGVLNDLWEFDGTNWIWVSGSDFPDQSGVYGTKGVAGPNNVPGGRECPISWIDASGNLWLFGGGGCAVDGYGWLNDLWRFDGTNWTWVGGSNGVNQCGVYGTKGMAAASNVPGARRDSVSWIDVTGNFWLFGGWGYAASGTNDYLNDLWKFDGTNWTWVSGSDALNPSGVFGAKGLAGPNNVPGGRGGSISWIDGSGNLWLFGGSDSIGQLNDLWKFGIPDEAADMMDDGAVNELDLAILASQWLSAPGEPSADLAPNPAGDGVVNFRDFAVLAGKWLDSF
jgi:hypothetical protein